MQSGLAHGKCEIWTSSGETPGVNPLFNQFLNIAKVLLLLTESMRAESIKKRQLMDISYRKRGMVCSVPE